MKKQQLLALGLAITITGSTMAGGTVKAAAVDAASEPAVTQEADGGEVKEEAEPEVKEEVEPEVKEEAAGEEEEKSAESENPEEITEEEAAKKETEAPVQDEVNQAEKSEDSQVETENKEPEKDQKAVETESGRQDSAVLAAADKSELNKLIEYVDEDLANESWYTPESFRACKEALDVAKAVMQDEGATQEQVDSALNTLLEAYKKLEFTLDGYRKYIQGMLDEAAMTMSGELLYTPESWAVFQAAKQNMLAIRDNPLNYTAEERSSIINAFIEAFNKLALRAEVTDKTELKEMIAQIKSIAANPGLYTPETVARVKKYLADNDTSDRAVDALNSIQAEQMKSEISQLLSQVELSVEGLKTQANSLAGIVVELKNTGAYDLAELEALSNRINNVKTVLENPSITTDQIMQAAAELNSIQQDIENLEINIDNMRNLLEELVNGADFKGMNDSIQAGDKTYAKQSRDSFIEMYQAAQELLNAPVAEHTSEDYYNAYMALKMVRGTMVTTETAGKTMLEDLSTIINQEKDKAGKPEGITQQNLNKLMDVQARLREALKASPVDNDQIELLTAEADTVILEAVNSRIPKEVKKPEVKPVKVETGKKVTENKKVNTTAKNPRTGDPASMTGLLAMLGTSAGVIAGIKRKKDKDEDEEE